MGAVPDSPVIEACRTALGREMEALRSFRGNGGKVLGYLCQSFPPEVAAGLGMWPVRVLEKSSTQLEDRGGELVRPDVCPMVKVVLGGAASKEGIFGEIDSWAGLATCDQTRRCFQAMPRMTETSVHFMQVPSTRTDEASGYYCDQIVSFCDQAVGEGHSAGYDASRAEEWGRARQYAGKVLSAAAVSGKMAPLDLHWMFHLYHTARPEGLAEFFGKLVDEAPEYLSRMTVAVAGSSIPLEDVTLLQAVQSAGASVLPLYCSGLQSTPFLGLNRLPVSFDPAAFAAEYFRSVRCARSRPNDGMFDYIETAVRESGAAGLIVRTMKFCDLWFTERMRFRERSCVPVLVLDTSFSEGEAERQLTRIDAFLETLGGLM